MITDKNEEFLARYGSPETTKEIFEKHEPLAKLSKIHRYEEEFKLNPFTHTDVVDNIHQNYNEDEFRGHRNLSKELFDKSVEESSGYRRTHILKSPNLTLDHVKKLQEKRQFTTPDYEDIGLNHHVKNDILDHVLKYENFFNKPTDILKMYGNTISNFSKNKNLNSNHISTLIKIGTKEDARHASPSITFKNIANHPNLSKENAEELRTKINHPYINELLDKRGM